MEPLESQEQFESEIWRPEKPNPALIVIYFTASWCSACKRLDLGTIMGSASPKVKFYKCDVDENDYTSSYCGVKSLPTFIAIRGGKVIDQLSSSVTTAVRQWLADVTEQSGV